MTTKTETVERLIRKSKVDSVIADFVRRKARFHPGMVYVMPRAVRLFRETKLSPSLFLLMHVCGVWTCSAADRWSQNFPLDNLAQNEINLAEGKGPIASRYAIQGQPSLWIITEDGITTFGA